jgi:hypothetical protein
MLTTLKGMDSRKPAEPIELSQDVIDGYFAYVRYLAKETARLRSERKPIPKRVPAEFSPLSQWLDEMLLKPAPEDGPERAWPVILELVARAPDDEALSFIGASAIEDLVNAAGSRYAERIEAASFADARFTRALAVVWPDAEVSDRVRSLIMRARETAPPVTFPHAG